MPWRLCSHKLYELWLNGAGVSDNTAVSIREVIAQKLMATRSWRRVASERSVGIEMHLAGAVAAMFMGSTTWVKVRNATSFLQESSALNYSYLC